MATVLFYVRWHISYSKMKVNQDHWSAFLDFAEINPCILTNKFSNPNGRSEASKLWSKLVGMLNGLGYGTKTIEEWRKAVTDWKCKVKAKAAKVKQEIEKTEGGEQKQPPLNKCEERLLNILGRKNIDGDNVRELGFSQTSQSVSLTPNTNDTLDKIQVEDNCNIPQLFTLRNDVPSSSNSLSLEGCNYGTSKAECKKRLFEGTSTSMHTAKKEKLENRTKNQRLQLSSRLIEANTATLNTLKNIDKNVEKMATAMACIADSLQAIANALKK